MIGKIGPDHLMKEAKTGVRVTDYFYNSKERSWGVARGVQVCIGRLQVAELRRIKYTVGGLDWLSTARVELTLSPARRP